MTEPLRTPVLVQDAQTALARLAKGLDEADALLDGAVLIDSAEIPEADHGLLVHHDHMTTRLQGHHGRPVELRVLHECVTDDRYRRMILLTLQGSAKVVEFGIVQIELAYTPEAVRREILARNAPLGDILIRHNVLRRVEPKWYLGFHKPSRVLSYFGGTEVAFGRIGVIHCNGHAGIELLEVVPNGMANSE